ncbi:MAG: ATP-binding cassette domain-containing protein [Planctomycetota bacterium]
MDADAPGTPGLGGETSPTSSDIRDFKALTIDGLCLSAGGRTLIDDCDVVFPAGRITVLVGPSGAGKSLLLRLMAGLLPRSQGEVQWCGSLGWDHEPWPEASTTYRSTSSEKQRSRVGVVFQQFALFDELSPLANVQFAMDHRGLDVPGLSSEQWLSTLRVPADSSVSVLSGGQKQRLAIARTLASQPDVLLYDEPTSGLDAATGAQVADLIRETQSRFGRTSIVVTHDYDTLLPIADKVILLDASEQKLVPVPADQHHTVAAKMSRVLPPAVSTDQTQQSGLANATVSNEGPVRASVLPRTFSSARRQMDSFFVTTGAALIAAARLPLDLLPVVPRFRWAARFGLHYLNLVGGFSACAYLLMAGLIAGFTTTYFTLRFLPFRLYTQPLLMDDLLASIGFALYRVLVPVLATVLIAARCGAAVAADVGVKRYNGGVDALKTLGVLPAQYLLLPLTVAFLMATPFLEWIAFVSARWISCRTFAHMHPEIGAFFWQQHFARAISATEPDGLLAQWLLKGWGWVQMKNLLCAIGTATISYHQGMREKGSASDVSAAITATVLWTTLWVLVVHFLMALLEF